MLCSLSGSRRARFSLKRRRYAGEQQRFFAFEGARRERRQAIIFTGLPLRIAEVDAGVRPPL
jgi:hypothetical protein